ncbi:MAG TPA: iron-sulfur cluster insertion protein ErpA [Kofleriaceae bacterium]|nr:iron-sulfur cluster insertion protein ErpA [Kofleriaceae bacterium]
MSEQEAYGVTPESGSVDFLPKAAEGEAGDGEETLVSLTRLAAEKVLEIRASEGIEEDMALRLRVVGGGCSGFSYDLYFDSKNEMDRELQSHGVRLVVDQMSLMYLVGTEVDYVEGLAGAGFKFQNPNVKSTCGCGSSFQV